MQYIVDRLCQEARVSIRVTQDSSLMRPAEESVVLADSSKIGKELGWQSNYGLEQSLRDTLDFWRAQPSVQ
jgi:GDP-4-dehydro-6-deoxy-D-mannose reductase